MSIKLACPNGHLLNIPHKLAGREVPCPRCGQLVQVPASEVEAVIELLSTTDHRPEAVPDFETIAAPAVTAPPTVTAVPAVPVVVPAIMSVPLAPSAPQVPALHLSGYACPDSERRALWGILFALGAVAVTLLVPAGHDMADHASAARSLGVARWAYALLVLTLVQGACAVYVWQAPDWSSVFAVAILELVLAMLLAFVFGLLVAARADHGLIRWMDLQDAARSDLPRLWCFFAISLASGAAFWSGRHSLAWRKRLVD